MKGGEETMGDIYNGLDRRRRERAKASFVAVCQTDEPLKRGDIFIAGQQFDAIMLDLNENGMAISVNYNITVSSRIYIEFTLVNIKTDENNQVEPIELTGEVRNNVSMGKGEHRIGILFTQISQKNKAVIASFVNAKKSKGKGRP